MVLQAEEILGGTIVLGTETEEVIMPAFVLEDIAKQLAPEGAPLQDGSLIIESGRTMIAVLIVSLGDVTMSAADMGDYIQFTLNVPGFEPNTLSVAVQKETLLWAFWIQMGLLAVSSLLALMMIWWFVAMRRRKRDEDTRTQRANASPPPGTQGAFGI